MKKKGIIISGGDIDRDFALAFLKLYAPDREDSYVIAADKGLVFCQENEIAVDAVVGDFDSTDQSRLERYKGLPVPLIRLYRPEKDWTDTELAADLALEKGIEQAVLIGGTGTRFDHMLGNVQVMERMLLRGLVLQIVDPHNRITMHKSGFTMKKKEQWGDYVSLLPWAGDVTGLTLKGFYYPVQDFTLPTAGSLGISNVITDEVAKVDFSGGKLLVVEAKD